MSEGLSCAELVELVTDYLEERLPEGERARFDAHLAECPGCVAHVEQARTTVRLAGRLRERELDVSLHASRGSRGSRSFRIGADGSLAERPSLDGTLSGSAGLAAW